MRKLANISAFERLQNQANTSFVSDLSVFNRGFSGEGKGVVNYDAAELDNLIAVCKSRGYDGTANKLNALKEVINAFVQDDIGINIDPGWSREKDDNWQRYLDEASEKRQEELQEDAEHGISHYVHHPWHTVRRDGSIDTVLGPEDEWDDAIDEDELYEQYLQKNEDALLNTEDAVYLDKYVDRLNTDDESEGFIDDMSYASDRAEYGQELSNLAKHIIGKAKAIIG